MSASATAARSVAPQCGARTQASSLRRARAPRSRALARASADDGASTASVRVFTGSSKEALFGAQQNMLALLEATSRDDAAILAAIDELEKLNPTPAPARHNSLLGKWRLRWSQQQESSNFFQKLFAGVASDNFQILNKDDTLENLVLLGPLTVSATAPTQAVSDSRTEVRISTVDVSVGGTRVWRKTLEPKPGRGAGWVEQLYLDDELRISRGNKGSLFVHSREFEGTREASGNTGGGEENVTALAKR
jgi:hypothetical protein